MDFSKLSPPPIAQIPGPWFRVHQTVRTAIYFGRNSVYRWDAPDQSYGVLYAGESWQGAFMESVLHDPTQRIVLQSELKKRSMAFIKTATPLRLVDLSEGVVLRALGLSEADTKGYPYTRSQEISKAIQMAGWNIHGIRYASRLEPKLACLALFDCPDGFVNALDLDELLAPGNQGLVRSMLNQYQIHLINDL
jgi:hypothetical protein